MFLMDGRYGSRGLRLAPPHGKADWGRKGDGHLLVLCRYYCVAVPTE